MADVAVCNEVVVHRCRRILSSGLCQVDKPSSTASECVENVTGVQTVSCPERTDAGAFVFFFDQRQKDTIWQFAVCPIEASNCDVIMSKSSSVSSFAFAVIASPRGWKMELFEFVELYYTTCIWV